MNHYYFFPPPQFPQDNKTKIRKASWQETDTKFWCGEAPKIDIQWDGLYSFMLAIVLRLNKRHTSLGDVELVEKFLQMLTEYDILRPEEAVLLDEMEEITPPPKGGGSKG